MAGMLGATIIAIGLTVYGWVHLWRATMAGGWSNALRSFMAFGGLAVILRYF